MSQVIETNHTKCVEETSETISVLFFDNYFHDCFPIYRKARNVFKERYPDIHLEYKVNPVFIQICRELCEKEEKKGLFGIYTFPKKYEKYWRINHHDDGPETVTVDFTQYAFDQIEKLIDSDTYSIHKIKSIVNDYKQANREIEIEEF